MTELDGVFFKEIVEQGLREFPNECCGVIAANGDGRPVKVFTMKNADASPVTYRLDGKEQLQVFDEMDEQGWELWAIYHSHTHSEAYPSDTDRRLAFYPESRYMVLSLADREQPELRSFFITDGAVDRRGADDRMTAPTPMFNEDQVQRYSRHIILPNIGGAGQRKLLDASVLVIGAGGLGSPVAMYLAAAGIGKIGIVDFDRVDVTNLQRQILHTTADVGRSKVESAVEHLRAINPTIDIVAHDTLLFSTNVFDVMEPYDVVIDGTDNFPVRYLVNDATQFLGKPLVYGSIFQWEGQATVFMPGQDAPCYRCLFPSPPPPGTVPSCAEGGVFGVLPGVIGSIQATEAIKLITGEGESLVGRLLLYDALHMDFQEVKIRWDADCPVCGKAPTITELIDYEAFCGVPARAD